MGTKRRRWEEFIGGDKVQVSDSGGKVGLYNIGNTCFMNTALQCLAHLDPFVAYFLSGKYREEINMTSPLSTRGEFVCAFAGLLQELWQKPQPAVRPSSLREVLQRRAPHLFDCYEQQDTQEFLAFCLDQLHEDLNRVERPPKPKTEREEEAEEKRQEGLDEEFVAALSWMQYLERGKSFLVDLFQGQLRSALTCRSCGHRARRFEAFLYLTVPVERTGSMGSVAQAIEKYLETEELSGDERWKCPKCKRKVDASKKMDIWKLPPVLVLHLKRFEFDMRRMRFGKIDKLLTCPLSLDLSGYVASPQREHSVYDIVAVANHIGPFGSGHYTAACQVSSLGREVGDWYCFNDDRVKPISANRVVGKDAYVIFLVRRAGEGQAMIRRQSASLPEVWPHFVSSRNSKVLDFYHGREADDGLVEASVKSSSSSEHAPPPQASLLAERASPSSSSAAGAPSAGRAKARPASGSRARSAARATKASAGTRVAPEPRPEASSASSASSPIAAGAGGLRRPVAAGKRPASKARSPVKM